MGVIVPRMSLEPGESVSDRSPRTYRRRVPSQVAARSESFVRIHWTGGLSPGRSSHLFRPRPILKTSVGSSGWPMTAALLLLGAIPLAAGLQALRAGRRRANRTSQGPLLCVAPGSGAAYRRRCCVHRPACVPFPDRHPPPKPLLASSSRQAAGRIWTRRYAFGTVDDAF